MATAGPGLANVGAVIAVSSGKGGVGKSTVAVNLAYSLAASGARVGLLDADVHGPSLPIMVSPAATDVVKTPAGRINALQYEGVACMSYGWIAPRNARGERSGAVMRGPMVSTVLQQMLKFTAWGTLDYLVVDTPPGTGDIHITLGQAVPIATAVIVTTPQRLAFADVAKGLDMYRALRVAPSAFVLNMSYFRAPDTGTVYRPFGDAAAALQALAGQHGVASAATFELPMEADVSLAGDTGKPYVLRAPGSEAAGTYARLAALVAGAAERAAVERDGVLAASAAAVSPTLQAAGPSTSTSASFAATGGTGPHSPQDTASLGGSVAGVVEGGQHASARYQAARGGFVVRLLSDTGARETVVAPRTVRLACRCAACIDEETGAAKLQPARVPADVVPTKVTAQGNYALAVQWSDGHASGIYTLEQLLALGGQADK